METKYYIKCNEEKKLENWLKRIEKSLILVISYEMAMYIFFSLSHDFVLTRYQGILY